MTQPALIDLPSSGGEVRDATFSPDGMYRYRLDRTWDTALPRALWVMLNGSSAGKTADDPTVRRCRSFSKRERCGGMTVVNLYGLVSTDPAGLRTHPDPVGSENLAHIRLALHERPAVIIAAWGASIPDPDHAAEITDLITDRLKVINARLDNPKQRRVLKCLGTTKTGQPRHPLYVAGKTKLTPYWSGMAA